MLQRIHDTGGRWIAVILLGLVSFGFIFWGVDFGLNGATTFAAKVNGEDLPLTEFDAQLQNRQNQYQQLYRSELTEDMRRELRRSVIEEMVREAALKQRADQEGYRVSNERLTESIRAVPQFQVGGQFSMEAYRGFLANQGMTPVGFETLQRESLEIRELEGGIAESTFLTPAEFRRYIELYNQRREIAYAVFDAAAFAANVTVDDAAIASRYESNQASYQTTETVDLEYVELALADIAAGIQVTDEELRAAYEQERDRFQTAEERRARHILIEVPEGEEEQARATADSVEQRLRNGEDFAALANELSADAGTKAQGGDLGWVSRGMLVGPFEDTLFGMQTGETSAPVRTEFGFHIIRLDETRAGEQQPFEVARDELAAEVKTRRAESEFYDRANQLGERAFDTYNELATISATMQLPLKSLVGFSRSGDASVFGENSAAVVQAAFAEEIVDSGRNSELVELADDHVLVLRVTAHHLPQPKPLEEVREQIRGELTSEQSQELAEDAAEAFLADLEQGAADPAAAAAARNGIWAPAAWVERTDAAVPTEVLSAAFGVGKPPAGGVLRESVALANGSRAVLVVSNVAPGEPSSMTQTERDQRQSQLAEQSARAELTSYRGNVREQATVRIPDAVLEPPVY
jgi:peptidyl-prolyl cis-trans isomerase D